MIAPICRRCGSKAVSVWYHNGTCRMRCGYCEADTGEQKSAGQAMKIWDTFKRAETAEPQSSVRVLSKDELIDSAFYDSSDIRPVWFENRGIFCCPALVQYGMAEREHGCVRVEWHGSFGSQSYDLQNYGSWWRCWSEKPSIEVLESEQWE